MGTQNVGKAQGVYVASSADGSTQMMAFTAMMEGGEYGDSLNFFGVYRIGSTMLDFQSLEALASLRMLVASQSSVPFIPAGQHATNGAETLRRITVLLTY